MNEYDKQYNAKNPIRKRDRIYCTVGKCENLATVWISMKDAMVSRCNQHMSDGYFDYNKDSTKELRN